jgi:bis(5'-nucleosyl)-tetraphosphatase (symmetrical)
MARYAIGDIQGCYHSLMALLARLNFQPDQDSLWLVGDIINRGTGTLEVLRWAYAHSQSIKLVLGNHDLHAIAVAHHVRPPHRFDTLSELLAAPDCNELLDWLRQQPLMILEDDFAMLHAGVYPQWTLQQAWALAAEVEAVLQSQDYPQFLHNMYGNQPASWDDSLTGIDRLRAITNAFTRMRLVDAEGRMEFSFKGELPDVPAGHFPWFQAPNRQSAQATQPILVGHWSALGLYREHGVIALDTGCLWGRQLTAYDLDQHSVTQVALDPRDRPAIVGGD